MDAQQGHLLRIKRLAKRAYSESPGANREVRLLCTITRAKWKVDLYFLERDYFLKYGIVLHCFHLFKQQSSNLLA